MNALGTSRSVMVTLATLYDAGYLLFYQNPILLADGDDRLVSWPNHHPGASYNSELAFGTLDQYRHSLQDRSFLALVHDGAILKVSYRFRRDILVGHSLWYWPCPLSLPDDSLASDSPLDVLEHYLDEWQVRVRFRTPLRFDYDSDNARPGHAASHLHIQDSGCRIPVTRPLGFDTFIKFVFTHFYNDLGDGKSTLHKLPSFQDLERTMSFEDADLHSPHIHWAKAL